MSTLSGSTYAFPQEHSPSPAKLASSNSNVAAQASNAECCRRPLELAIAAVRGDMLEGLKTRGGHAQSRKTQRGGYEMMTPTGYWIEMAQWILQI
jgi:hypothetical protein